MPDCLACGGFLPYIEPFKLIPLSPPPHPTPHPPDHPSPRTRSNTPILILNDLASILGCWHQSHVPSQPPHTQQRVAPNLRAADLELAVEVEHKVAVGRLCARRPFGDRLVWGSRLGHHRARRAKAPLHRFLRFVEFLPRGCPPCNIGHPWK